MTDDILQELYKQLFTIITEWHKNGHPTETILGAIDLVKAMIIESELRSQKLDGLSEGEGELNNKKPERG